MAKSTEQKNTETKEEKKVSKLVGCTVVLDPSQGGMFVDQINNINLNFFPNAKGEVNDRVVITDTMDLRIIKRGISFGILKVIKNDKDITENITGRAFVDTKNIPLVEGIKEPEKKDITLINYINSNNIDDIIVKINGLSNYEILSRLKDLEELGQNPSAGPRSKVIDALCAQMKKFSGMALNHDKSKDEVITLK